MRVFGFIASVSGRDFPTEVRHGACFALFALLCGCALRQDVLEPFQAGELPVEINADPHNPLHKLRTFAVAPLAEAAQKSAGEITDPLSEKLFLQDAAGHLMKRGY